MTTAADLSITKTNGKELALREEDDGEMSIAQVVAQVTKVKELMRAVMKEGVHYGTIPGTPKPTLYKPGAETLCMLFRLEPQYAVTKEREGTHLHVDSTCILIHIPTGQRRATGMGSCSTKEKKYAYRHGKPNLDIADQFNTVLKMSNKRALIAAVLNATAASDVFTQDLEDMPEFEQNEKPAAKVKRSRIMPSEPDEPGRKYADAAELMDTMVTIERMIDAGELGMARRYLGSAANPAAEGSVTAAITASHNMNQISENYRKELGKVWQRINRRLTKLETAEAEQPTAYPDDLPDTEAPRSMKGLVVMGGNSVSPSADEMREVRERAHRKAKGYQPTDHDLNELVKIENEAREVFSDESGSPDEQPGAH